MFLKSLEVFGFKSFADRTRIEFADGITALLGPNGCGKSNVVDAIKWVLGEQATKSLRAENMEDVIFNGTENRKALNVAEVALTLGNEDNLLPLELSEITVRRRLYRNGDSEYYVNNAPVKLKELRELFYDTGVGKSAYSIMEQGKIDQVLSNKPEERRNLFEEAAGITKFKIRGQEAERKLEKTDENIRQIEGILGEVRRSYEALKKQAEKTEAYRKLKDESFETELEIQLLRLRETLEHKEKTRKELEALQNEKSGLKSAIDGINETLESSLDEMNSMETQLVEAQKALYGAELEKNNLDNQVKLLTERIQEIQAKIAADQGRVEGLGAKLGALGEEIAASTSSLEEFKLRIGETDAHIAQFAENVESAQKRIKDNADELKVLDERIVAWDKEGLEAERLLKEITDSIVSQLDRSLGESGYDAAERRRAEEALKSQLEALAISLRGRIDFVDDLERSGGAADRERGLAKIREGLLEGLKQLDQVKVNFDRYQGALPLFLDEFLAPEGTITKKRDLDARIAEIRGHIGAARARILELGDENRNLTQKIDEYRDTLEELRLGKERLLGQSRAVEEARSRAQAQIRDLEAQVNELKNLVAEDQGRINGLEAKIAETQGIKKNLIKQESELQKQLTQLEKGISSHNKTRVSKEKQLKSQMGHLALLQEKTEKAQISMTEVLAEIKNIYGNFRERYSRDLSEFEDRIFEIRTPVKDLRERASGIRDSLKTLGSVNLMAVEEFAEIKERYDFLTGQLDDLKKAKDDLLTVTKEIRQESAQLLLETFEKIRRNFHVLFRRLFGGGRAELKLSDPDNILESGIDILAQPPGKKLENIALLSGGERSLTAVGLLFATYIVKPSPFCLLDEIDAALDESNVGRFVSMLVEFGETSQFIVITHNKRTVTGAKTLLGVTMEESGVSKIIAIRLSHEAPVDPYVEGPGASGEAGTGTAGEDGRPSSAEAAAQAEIREREET